MACENAKLSRFVVQIIGENGCGTNVEGPVTAAGPVTFKQISKIGGVSLGEEGTIDVPDWDRIMTISDGKRKIPPITMQLRIDAKPILLTAPQGDTSNGEESIFAYWFENRGLFRPLVRVWKTDRAWRILYGYEFKGVEIRSLKEEDQELGATKVLYWDMDFSPYDSKMIACDLSDITTYGSDAPTTQFTGICA